MDLKRPRDIIRKLRASIYPFSSDSFALEERIVDTRTRRIGVNGFT